MVELTNKEFFQDLDQTIAAQLFEQTTYPWEILPLIKDFVLEVGPTLSADEYDQVEEDVWIAKSAMIAKTATINGPAIIGPDTEVRPGAFIRGNALIGAYTYAPAREISVYDYTQIMFSAIMGLLVFGQLPDMLSFVGYCVIIAAGVIMFLYNKRRGGN